MNFFRLSRRPVVSKRVDDFSLNNLQTLNFEPRFERIVLLDRLNDWNDWNVWNHVFLQRLN